jgi:predicted metallo-beta-lactamase superfamily hydrolase
MEVLVIGTESLGVRGLSCLVHAGSRRYLIDPGVALGYVRCGLLPHPCQVAIGDAVRERIVSAFHEATDIVFSHYHGDHVPLREANPYQLPLGRVPYCEDMSVWAKGPSGLSTLSLKRRQDLMERSGWKVLPAEGTRRTGLCFSGPVPHGPPQSRLGSVMMTCIRDGDESFVHASDIQLLNPKSAKVIMDWKPNVVIASGPPLYLDRITRDDRLVAWQNAIDIAACVDLLILDHHLLRSCEGFSWLERLSDRTGGNVVTASEFMGRKPCILEAQREELYERVPVPPGWHEAYARGDTGFLEFVDMLVAEEMNRAVSQEPVGISTFL